MKRIGFIMLLWALLTACEDKLDITPKGMTVLGKVDELETLLNQSYGLERLQTWELCAMNVTVLLKMRLPLCRCRTR